MSWPAICKDAGSGCRRSWCGDCCTRWGIRCRPRRSRTKVAPILIVTVSSVISTRWLPSSSLPVSRVDTKKKELIGGYANGGREWQPAGEPERVNVHDFADRSLGEFAKAIPYGVYDV